jgi:hypothetical protein
LSNGAELILGPGVLVEVAAGDRILLTLAERGSLAEAVAILAEVDRIEELTQAEIRSLAGWYVALDEKDKSSAARLRSFDVMSEYQLSNELHSNIGRYDRNGDAIPEELDPDIPLQFVELLEPF